MSAPTTRADLLTSADVPTALLAACAVASAALWWWTHRAHLRPPWLAIGLRLAIGLGTIWFALQTAARFVTLATPMSLWLLSAIGAVAVAAIAGFYRHEQSIVGTREGRRLSALRIAAATVLVVVLAEPQRVEQFERTKPREVIVLVDGSASMALIDHKATTSEKMELAALFDVGGDRRGESLSGVARALSALDRRLAKESAALQAPAGASAGARSLVAARGEALAQFFDAAGDEAEGLAETVAGTRDSDIGLSEATGALLSDYDARIREEIAGELRKAAEAVRRGDFDTARALGHGIAQQLRFVLRRLPSAAAEVDQLHYNELSQGQQRAVDTATQRPRWEIAREILRAEIDGEESLAALLSENYRLRFVRFGESTKPLEPEEWLEGDDDETPGDSRSDLGTALGGIADRSGLPDLAGVIVLSDGRHFGDRSAEAGARRLGMAGVPVCAVAVGSTSPTRDASVVSTRAPQVVHVEDKATISADIRTGGMSGDALAVVLRFEGKEIDQQTVNADDGTTTVRFSHSPGSIGVFDYEISVAAPGGDTVPANDRRAFRLATTDDRVDVLLADHLPRWEFRYLRNLFHARDPSVHLQHVLLEPDAISELDAPPEVNASADRKFGDAEATALPASPEEWSRFDALILGDLPADALSPEQWQAIERAVAESGALLVIIAGPQAMPHQHDNEHLLDLLPTLPAEDLQAGNTSYRLRATASGATHPIMRLSDDPQLDQLVWGGLPVLHWRHASGKPKAGAEVLAWAQPSRGVLADQLVRRRGNQTGINEPLAVAHRYGLGRVLLLNFDATWRLRYATGDLYHHRFWGGVLRWGGGRLLRAGGEGIRLGSDRLTYAPGDTVRIDAELTPAAGESERPARVSLVVKEGDRKVSTVLLEQDEGGAGEYSGEFPAPDEPGTYSVSVHPPGRDEVATEIAVTPADEGRELAELTVDRAALENLSDLSGGTVVGPGSATALLPYLRDPGRTMVDRRVSPLWDRLWILGVLLALLSAEWICRRKASLS